MDQNHPQNEALLHPFADEFLSYLGRTLGRYTLKQLIGVGGMGAVFLAVHEQLDKNVALKLLQEINREEDNAKRFFQEAKAAAATGHENIIQVFDVDEDPELGPYLVMEYLEGATSLADLLEQEKKLSLPRVGWIALQIAEALDATHSQGVVHCDLKPSNILLIKALGKTDVVKIIDFGIAKTIPTPGEDITITKTVRGTPKYMSPEQVVGRRLDGRSDEYALGVLVYQMICGKPPFTAAAPGLLMRQQFKDPPPLLRTWRPSLPNEAEKVVLQALEKKPHKRFRTILEFGRALVNALPTVADDTAEHAVDISSFGKDFLSPVSIDQGLDSLPVSPVVSQSQEDTEALVARKVKQRGISLKNPLPKEDDLQSTMPDGMNFPAYLAEETKGDSVEETLIDKPKTPSLPLPTADFSSLFPVDPPKKTPKQTTANTSDSFLKKEPKPQRRIPPPPGFLVPKEDLDNAPHIQVERLLPPERFAPPRSVFPLMFGLTFLFIISTLGIWGYLTGYWGGELPQNAVTQKAVPLSAPTEPVEAPKEETPEPSKKNRKPKSKTTPKSKVSPQIKEPLQPETNSMEKELSPEKPAPPVKVIHPKNSSAKTPVK